MNCPNCDNGRVRLPDPPGTPMEYGNLVGEPLTETCRECGGTGTPVEWQCSSCCQWFQTDKTKAIPNLEVPTAYLCEMCVADPAESEMERAILGVKARVDELMADLQLLRAVKPNALEKALHDAPGCPSLQRARAIEYMDGANKEAAYTFSCRLNAISRDLSSLRYRVVEEEDRG